MGNESHDTKQNSHGDVIQIDKTQKYNKSEYQSTEMTIAFSSLLIFVALLLFLFIALVVTFYNYKVNIANI